MGPNDRPDVKYGRRLSLTLPPHDTALVAVATGPGVLLPFWEVRKPYQPTSDEWKPRVVGVSSAVWFDGRWRWKPIRAAAICRADRERERKRFAAARRSSLELRQFRESSRIDLCATRAWPSRILNFEPRSIAQLPREKLISCMRLSLLRYVQNNKHEDSRNKSHRPARPDTGRGWSNELRPEDCVHTLIAVNTDEGLTGWGQRLHQRRSGSWIVERAGAALQGRERSGTRASQ